MMEFYNQFFPVAMKKHECEYCKRIIKVGEQYSVESGKYDGDFFTRKLCMICNKILNDFISEIGTREFDWDEIDEYLADKFCSKCNYINPDFEECDRVVSDCPIIRNQYEKCNT